MFLVEVATACVWAYVSMYLSEFLVPADKPLLEVLADPTDLGMTPTPRQFFISLLFDFG